jgi:hypothetical protein
MVRQPRRADGGPWVRVRLEFADPQEVFELLEEAWRMTATKRAIKAFDEAQGRQPAPG